MGYVKDRIEQKNDGSLTNHRNVGILENPDGYGKVVYPFCGYLMEMFIKVKEETINEIIFTPGN